MHTISTELQGLKRASKNLFDSYLDLGKREVIGASKTAIIAKVAVLAFVALAIALSSYGLVYELVAMGMHALLRDASEYTQKIAAHGAILVVCLGGAFAYAKLAKDD